MNNNEVEMNKYRKTILLISLCFFGFLTSNGENKGETEERSLESNE